MEPHRPAVAPTELAQHLIAIPSVSGNEADILTFTEQWFRQHDFHDVIARPEFTAGVVRATTQPARKALILCGHVDTVAAGDETKWSHSPWEAYIKDGRLYGLGSGDMKAGVALQMCAAAEYSQSPRQDLDVWCVLVTNEEVDGSGSAAFTKFFADTTQYQMANCIIAEPTDNERIEIGHRGNRFVELVFAGESGHASQEQHYDSSALPKVVAFLNDLPQLRQELHHAYKHDPLGTPSFTPTKIAPEGTYSSNKTSAATCVAIDIRTTPPLDDHIESWLDVHAERYGYTWHFAYTPVNSALCADDAPILKHLQHIVPKATTTVSLGATDQAFFQDIGVDTVIYGPGDFMLAHTADESVSLDKLGQTYDAYVELLKRF